MASKHIRKNYYKNSAVKKSANRKRRLMQCIRAVGLAAIMAVMSLAFVLCYDFLTQSDYFNIQKTQVTGAHRFSPEQIIAQSKIQKGTNVLSINLSKARKRLLAHPWIKEAEVSRKLPNEIHIAITEHRSLALLDLGRKFIINTDGIIFKEWAPTDPENLPKIIGLEYTDLNVADNPRSAAFDAVMTVLMLGQKKESILPNTLIKKIQVDREMGITLHAGDEGKLIKLGYNDYLGKYKNLKNILYHLNHTLEFSNFDSIDLNNLNRIVVNPVNTGTSAVEQKEV